MKGFGDLYKSTKRINKKTILSKEQKIKQAIQLQIQGNIKEATNIYKNLISEGCDNPIVFSNYGIILQSLGKLKEAEISTRKAIELNPDYAMAYSNLGNILHDLGKLKEAEISTRKAIEFNPNLAEAHLNLGNILRDLGKLQEAELSYRKAIECNPNLAKAHYSLSIIKLSDDHKIWEDQLFSENILNNKSQDDQIDIYFARSNFLHKEKNYEESSKYLQLANNLKLRLNPSNCKTLMHLSNKLLIESDKHDVNKKEQKSSSENIFIVGMPRCGSTLLESILSMNNNVYDLGETKLLGDSFIECKTSKQDLNLSAIYKKKINIKTKLNITTDKNLYNYKFVGIIASQIPNAKIIHCFRNPLDNILSIYRTNFSKGNEYSSSLVDCARVYLDQEEIMKKYKKRFRSKIYNLNYDLLVSNPKKEIKSLISWLGWKWNDAYLSPNLNTRSVSTASSVQVRFPINSKSIDAWKNYKEMLKPAIKILNKTNIYKDIIS